MNNTVDLVTAATIFRNTDTTNTTQTEQSSGSGFSDVLTEALNAQPAQSAMTGMYGQSGTSDMGGLGAMGTMNPLFGFMPSMTSSIEDALSSGIQDGEMSGMHMMLLMMLMMMQSSNGSGELGPVLNMMVPFLSQSIGENLNTQNSPLTSINGVSADTNPGIKRMLDAALSQVGYHEKNKDGSVGNGNYTTFGAWYGMDGQPWCAMFVSWAAHQGNLLGATVPRHASCAVGITAYKERGLYEHKSSGYIPREGDTIYFQDSTGRVNHVGLVVAFDPITQKIYTVEGNSNNAVRIRHYDLNSSKINGYGKNGGTSFGIIPHNSTEGANANLI